MQLRERFVKDEPMTDRGETYAAIRKALATLDDPSTRLLEPARLAALRRGTAGSLTGVGLEVGFDTTSSSAQSAQPELVVRSPPRRESVPD